MYKKIYVEITNICNLSCPFCIGNKREKEFMSLDNFKIILNKLSNHTNYLYFHVLGEPLMHPAINEFIDLAAEKYKINITTNGYLINKIKNNKNIRQINISLHSFNKLYNIQLKDYMNNIMESINNLKDKTYISLRLWRKTKYTNNILSYLENYYNTKIDKHKKLEENVFIEFENEFEWPSLELKEKYSVGTCYALKDHIAILVDGTIVPCCLDTKGDINLGNIYNNNIDEIKCTNKYKNVLLNFQNNKKCEDLCKRCNFINKS